MLYHIMGLKEVNMENVKKNEEELKRLKNSLAKLGPMRPGSLTLQYKNPDLKTGGYHQISYTHKMRSRTEYVRPEFVKQVAREVGEYKKFRKTVQAITDLSIELSKMRMGLTGKGKKR